MKTNRAAIIGMGLFSALITSASSPVPLTAFDVSTTSTSIVVSIEFESNSNQTYNVYSSANLLSNDWNAVATDIPGTGSTIVQEDEHPLSEFAHFYKATTTDAAPINLIANGDFETPALESGGTDIDTSGDWSQDGNNQSIQKATWAAETGEQGAWLKGWTANLDRSFWQDVAGTSGMEYTLDAAFKFNPNFEPNGSTLEMAMIWLDSGNTEISRITLDINENLDSAEGWKHLNITGIAPANTAFVRASFRFTTDDTIETSSNSSALIDNVSLTMQSPGLGWGGFSSAHHVAAAQYAGLYAAATDHTVQVSKIEESSLGTFIATNINGMAFTASGRQLFVATPDSVTAYNAGTGQTRDFVTGLTLGSGKTGIAHFKGELFVGTAGGDILRYAAQLGDLTGTPNGTITVGEPVRSIAVDIQDEMLYVASDDHLYRLNPTNAALSQIATVSNMVSITFGRTYGAAGQGGLVILQDHGTERQLHLVSTADLQAGGPVSTTAYINTTDELKDIAATACGRILTAEPVPEMITDAGDTRLDFMEWVADEFDQNVRFAKVLCWQDGGLPGMVQNTVTSFGKNRGVVASPDAAYWVVNQLLMSHHINGDLEAQGMVREILKRYATLDVNTDGQWYHWYDSTTGERTWGDVGPDAETSAYSTMKAVHMAIRAKEYFPYDSEIETAADTIIGALRNQRDYVREFGSFASPADNLGPVLDGHRPSPYQELHLYSELMAATEPMCENAYLDYWRFRENHTYDYTLPDEPIIKTKTGGFWRMYDQATVGFCNTNEQWRQEFKNFDALYAGWTDDNAPEHLTAFSAGQVPDISKPDPATSYTYSSDKYTSHPGTVNSFGTVIGFGLHGNTVPVVGAYFAYRDGRRQLMEGSANYGDPNLLTRISYDYPTWNMNNLSPTDHQYAGYALGELLKPGSIANTIALDTYIEPRWTTQTNGDHIVEFSRLVKRQVWGTADGTNWDYLGFQHSPYMVPASAGYTNFTVIGAAGELLNPSTASATVHEYDVSEDFDDTLYIVRAVSTLTNELRVQWFNGASFISDQTATGLKIDAAKPAGATTMKVDLFGSAFDQISVELDGKLELFSNGNQGFELGNLNGWSGSAAATMTRANVAESRMEGSRACLMTAAVGTPNGDRAYLWCDYDITGDPTNTHYVFEQDVLTENLEGSHIRIHIEIKDGSGAEISRQYFDTFEKGNSQTVLSAGLRKRTTDFAKLRYLIELRRNDSSSVTAEERVFVDNLRMLKMKP